MDTTHQCHPLLWPPRFQKCILHRVLRLQKDPPFQLRKLVASWFWWWEFLMIPPTPLWDPTHYTPSTNLPLAYRHTPLSLRRTVQPPYELSENMTMMVRIKNNNWSNICQNSIWSLRYISIQSLSLRLSQSCLIPPYTYPTNSITFCQTCLQWPTFMKQ